MAVRLFNAARPLGRRQTATASRRAPKSWVSRVRLLGPAPPAWTNLGYAFESQGDFSKGIEYHGQHMAIAKEVGDRAGEGAAYANLGSTYTSSGGVSQAITYHTQDLAIAKQVGDQAGDGSAYRNLGTCHMHLNEFVKAVVHFEAQHALAISLKVAHMQSTAAMDMRVALTLHARAARQGPAAAGAHHAPGPHSHSSDGGHPPR